MLISEFVRKDHCATECKEIDVESAQQQEFESRVAELVEENILLQKELAIKSVISEISQLHVKENSLKIIYERIFVLLSEVIFIDNFYIVLVENELIDIPFMVDKNDDLDPDLLREDKNPALRNGLTGYALRKGISLVLTESEIAKLKQENEISMIGSLPKQWMFLPFHSANIEGGIVVQSYVKNDGYSYKDMSILAYVTMHIGNFLSAHNSQEKIKQQIDELKSTQSQLVHSEKMASIGQLAAGVAHEINNPLGYVNSNLNSLHGYIDDLSNYVGDMDKFLSESYKDCSSQQEIPNLAAQLKKKHDVEFILSDTKELITECLFGMDKVKKIIQSLKNFSHAGEEQKKKSDINKCFEETIRIVWNELKYHCEIKKEFGSLPETYCYPSQLNQVFMNLLINAGHATKENGIISVTTSYRDDTIIIEVRDNGTGIDEEHLSQLFNPFFTTKPVGQGTGLGLSISYGIIENHGGKIEVESEVGAGTCFSIQLPVVREIEEVEEI